MKTTTAIVDKLYPKVKEQLSKRLPQYKKCMASFIEKRSDSLFSVAPLHRIYFNTADEDEMFAAVGIERALVKSVMDQTYFATMSSFAQAAKSEMTILDMCIVRYFHLQKMQKELELSLIHLSFSGKFYPSIHYGSYPRVEPVEHVMLWVVNNALSNKFDIRTYGNVIGAIKSIAVTWLDGYNSRFKDFDDEDVVYLIQQLHNRIKSFMKNIASEYYKAYDDKDSLMTFDSDSLDSDNYHLADSDALKVNRIVEKAMAAISTTGVSYKYSKMSSNEFVKPTEMKAIIESILSDTHNLADIRELIQLIVSVYFSISKTKDVRDIDFITFTIAPKPNIKNKDIIRQKDIIENLLINNAPAYTRRRNRVATKSGYFKSIYTYFTLIIHDSNK